MDAADTGRLITRDGARLLLGFQWSLRYFAGICSAQLTPLFLIQVYPILGFNQEPTPPFFSILSAFFFTPRNLDMLHKNVFFLHRPQREGKIFLAPRLFFFFFFFCAPDFLGMASPPCLSVQRGQLPVNCFCATRALL